MKRSTGLTDAEIADDEFIARAEYWLGRGYSHDKAEAMARNEIALRDGLDDDSPGSELEDSMMGEEW